jgi:hypothetical protein
LHTYGVIYPAGLRRPELVSAGTQIAFRLYETISLGGGENARSCMACVRAKGMRKCQPYHLLFIGWPRGKDGIQKYQNALGISLSQKEYAFLKNIQKVLSLFMTTFFSVRSN